MENVSCATGTVVVDVDRHIREPEGAEYSVVYHVIVMSIVLSLALVWGLITPVTENSLIIMQSQDG